MFLPQLHFYLYQDTNLVLNHLNKSLYWPLLMCHMFWRLNFLWIVSLSKLKKNSTLITYLPSNFSNPWPLAYSPLASYFCLPNHNALPPEGSLAPYRLLVAYRAALPNLFAPTREVVRRAAYEVKGGAFTTPIESIHWPRHRDEAGSNPDVTLSAETAPSRLD